MFLPRLAAGCWGRLGTLSCVITMPLSKSEQELLLSGSLDDALSPDEQALLDQWFQEDPSALRQREELAEVRNQLRAALSPLRQTKLDSRFAERVIEAAIEQAQRENLAAEHPLVRLADQPAGSSRPAATGRSSRGSTWRWVAAAVALAASLLLVFYLGRQPDRVPAVGPQELAQADPNEPHSTAPVVERLAVNENAASPVDPSDPAAAQMQGAGVDSEPAAAPSLAGRLQQPLGPGSPSSAASTSERSNFEPSIAASSPMLAEAAPSVSVPAAAGDASTPQRVPLVAVLVVSVELTQAGRDSLAMLQALRAADIQLGPAALVEEQVVAQLQQSQVIGAADGESGAKLYYIEAPAKQLDRFLLRLMADRDSFAAFGFSIADSPGLLASVADWQQVDLTALRHADTQGLARDLVSADGTPLAVDEGPAFIPMPREMGTAGLLGTMDAQSSGGQDVDSQILLLIR